MFLKIDHVLPVLTKIIFEQSPLGWIYIPQSSTVPHRAFITHSLTMTLQTYVHDSLYY